MSDFFIRKIKCVVAGVVVEDLKVEFNVVKSIDASPNTASILIFNLKKENRQRIEKEFDSVVLEAGFKNGNFGVIFIGAVRTVVTKYYGTTDIVTEITAAEADENHRFAFVNDTLPAAKTQASDVIRFLHSKMTGVDLGSLVEVDGLPPKRRPMVLVGSVYDQMNRVCKDQGLYWSIQNNVLEVIKRDKAIEQIITVSQQTGMVGTPEPTELGVNVSMLLNHTVVPNRLIRVISSQQNTSGLFRVNQVEHSGSNIDGDFVNQIKAARAESAVATEQYKSDI